MSRRITTARQQVEMLSPWRTAMPVGDIPEGTEFKYDPAWHLAPDGSYNYGGYGDRGWKQPSVRAVHNSDVLGHITWHPDGEIKMIQVHPDWHRHGIATRLFDEAKRYMPDLHHSWLKSDAGEAWSAYEKGRHAAAKRTTTQDVIDDVRAKHGINLEMANTGGGCYVLEGRLEDGSWIRAADHNDFCYPELAARHLDEEEEGPLGWDVSFHSNAHDEGGTYTFPDGKTVDFPPADYWASSNDGADEIHWHSDPDARVEDLSRVIGDAFRTMPHDAKRVQQEKLRESLAASGWGPGDEEWERHFPGEGGKAIDVPTELPPATRKPHSLGDDEDYGDIFGKESMRRAAGFDWMPSGGGPSDDGGEEAHTELGDLVQTHHAYPPGRYSRDSEPIGHGYSIWEWDDSDPDDPAYEEFANSGDAVYPTHEEAKKAAEEHYYRIDHSKRKRGESRMDSGVDYDAVLKPKPLDDDFGDIFGKEGMLRTAAGWSESYQPWADWRRITKKDGLPHEWDGPGEYYNWWGPGGQDVMVHRRNLFGRLDRVAAKREPSDLVCSNGDCGAVKPGGEDHDGDYSCPTCGSEMDYDFKSHSTRKLADEYEYTGCDGDYGMALLEELHDRQDKGDKAAQKALADQTDDDYDEDDYYDEDDPEEDAPCTDCGGSGLRFLDEDVAEVSDGKREPEEIARDLAPHYLREDGGINFTRPCPTCGGHGDLNKAWNPEDEGRGAKWIKWQNGEGHHPDCASDHVPVRDMPKPVPGRPHTRDATSKSHPAYEDFTALPTSSSPDYYDWMHEHTPFYDWPQFSHESVDSFMRDAPEYMTESCADDAIHDWIDEQEAKGWPAWKGDDHRLVGEGHQVPPEADPRHNRNLLSRLAGADQCKNCGAGDAMFGPEGDRNYCASCANNYEYDVLPDYPCADCGDWLGSRNMYGENPVVDERTGDLVCQDCLAARHEHRRRSVEDEMGVYQDWNPDEAPDPDDPRIKGASRLAQMSWDEVMRRIVHGEMRVPNHLIRREGRRRTGSSECEECHEYMRDDQLVCPNCGHDYDDDPDVPGSSAFKREWEREIDREWAQECWESDHDEQLAAGELTNLSDVFSEDYLDGPHPGTLPRPGDDEEDWYGD